MNRNLKTPGFTTGRWMVDNKPSGSMNWSAHHALDHSDDTVHGAVEHRPRESVSDECGKDKSDQRCIPRKDQDNN